MIKFTDHVKVAYYLSKHAHYLPSRGKQQIGNKEKVISTDRKHAHYLPSRVSDGQVVAGSSIYVAKILHCSILHGQDFQGI